MNVTVTIKTFGCESSELDRMIPILEDIMLDVINQLANLGDPPIDIKNLKSIHFTENYREELFMFQQDFGIQEHATHNKIATGYTQVVYVAPSKSEEMQGYHIFCDKRIPCGILMGQLIEDNNKSFPPETITLARNEKNFYLRSLRHELAHVEDESNQKSWPWFEHAFEQNNVQTVMQEIALRMWEEYYACRRSVFCANNTILEDEIQSLTRDLDIAEKEICELRRKYNTCCISLEDFIKSFGDYLRTALFFCCYFMGHHDHAFDIINEKIQSTIIPSRFWGCIPELWKILREMNTTYPNWAGVEVLNALANEIKKCINHFEIYLRDEMGGIYYDIPVLQLKPISEE